MKRLHWIVLTGAMALLAGVSPARSESEAKPETNIADNFKVSWSSIAYNKRVSVRNPVASENQGQEVSETLSLSCEVEIVDANLVLGICREPLVEEVKDGKGGDIEIGAVSSGSSFMRYEALRYRRRYVTPTRQPRWKTAIRSALRLSQEESSRPRWVNELEPSQMRIGLDVGLSKQTGGEIGVVKGHFYVLMAESLEHIEVPFKPSDDWVHLTPDMEIRLQEAQCTERSFRFNIKTRPQDGVSMRPLSVQDYLPNRMVVAREFIGEDGKPTQHFSGIRRLPAHVSGSGSGGGSNCRIKSIRFVIAINPTHHEIPFVLEHIPLPKP